MPWEFFDVRILLLNIQARLNPKPGNFAHLQSSPASVAYTLLGGFVVAVSALPSPRFPDTSDSLEVQLVILGNQGEGEIHTMTNLFITPSFTDSRIQLYMNEVVFGTGFGILLGPHALDIFDPRSWTGITDTLTREIMRVVLVTGLFAIGVQLPKKYMATNARSLLIMVVPTMAFGWFVCAGKRASSVSWNIPTVLTLFSEAFVHVLFPKLDFVSSLVISACLTPTDPIISAAVIGQLVVSVHSSVLIAHRRPLVL